MRIFLAGATGVIGTRLVPLLVTRGEQVAGMTRAVGKAGLLRRIGAEPVICNVYDVEELTRAMVAFRPEMIIHQLTDLPDNEEDLPTTRAANARIRREGTQNLLTAARQAGANHFVAQSTAWESVGDGAIAKQSLERAVLDFGGVVIRYGRFYGPDTYYPDTVPDHPRIHIDEAARRTIDALHMSRQTVTITEVPIVD